jgi:2-dehydropantoate 2-reductase
LHSIEQSNNNKRPSLLIVGPGAIGSAIGFILQNTYDVFYYNRSGPVAHDARVNHNRSVVGNKFEKVDLERSGKCSIVLVTVKAYDLKGSIKKIAPLLEDGACVISLANGYVEPIINDVAKEYSHLIFRLGYATIGVSKSNNEYTIQTKGKGKFYWGAIDNREILSVEKELNENDYFCFDKNIIQSCRSKWLYNTALNSLVASKRLSTNGHALHHLEELEEIFTEAWALSKDLFGGLKIPKTEIWNNLLSLIKDTRDNENSMARDVRLGLKTETGFLAGLSLGFHPCYPKLNQLHRILAK